MEEIWALLLLAALERSQNRSQNAGVRNHQVTRPENLNAFDTNWAAIWIKETEKAT